MTNRPHTPVADATSILNADKVSTSTAQPTQQTKKADHRTSQKTDIKESSNTISKTGKKQKSTMETTSTHNPTASHIRLKQNAVNCPIPPRAVVEPGELPPAPNNALKIVRDKILEPPVTAEGLQELRIDKIMNSLKLRHDLNFDPELHYRANFDGDMGRNKRTQNEIFWRQLLSDLAAFSANPKGFLKANDGQTWTLPTALKNIKDIIKTLVAPDVVQMVEETLEIDHLMQELAKGVADLERWAGMVAEFLRNCCAPMRDQAVQDMKQRIIEGHRSHDIAILCNGIANLLSLVECMALDVANHQIRCLKEQMIKETVNYERHYIEKLVETGEFNIPHAYDWYRFYNTDEHIQTMFPNQYCAPERETGEHVFVDFEHEGRARGFYKGILHNFTYPLPGNDIPQLPLTFAADLDRIGRLRAGVLDAVNHEICAALVDKFTNMPSKKQSCERDPREHHTQLHLRLWLLLPHYAQDVDVEIPLREMSTPREQSLGIPRRFSQEKWRVAAPAVAIEILRAAWLPLAMLPEVEAALTVALDESSAEFKLQQTRVINRLGRLIEDALDDWFQVNSLELFNHAAKPPFDDNHKWTHKINPGKGIDMLLRNIARMTAHMGLHHWWIWETMAYAPCSRFIADYQRDGYTPMEQPTRPPALAVSLPASSDTPNVEELPRVINEGPDVNTDYHAVGELTGPANTLPLTPCEEAAKAIVPEVNDDAAAKQKADHTRANEDRVDNSRPRENPEARPEVKRPVVKRQDSGRESVLEEDPVDPAPE